MMARWAAASSSGTSIACQSAGLPAAMETGAAGAALSAGCGAGSGAAKLKPDRSGGSFR